jgi:beta-xylosidase
MLARMGTTLGPRGREDQGATRRPRWLIVIGAVAMVAVVAVVVVPDRTRPLDVPDPFVLHHDGGYLAYATNQHGGGANVQLLRSEDLERWEWVGDALPELGGWATEGATWAPSVLTRGDRFVLYYSAPAALTGLHCIGTATAASPQGPFRDEANDALICQADQRGVIDPSPVLDADGQAFLLWKNEGRFGGVDVDPPGEGDHPMRIWAQQLSDDGLELVGEPAILIDADQEWEAGIVEAPAMARHGDGYLLLYSGNLWSTEDYAVGWAACETPLGPCEKPSDEPLLSSSGSKRGPGHTELFVDAGDRLRVVYHAWDGEVGYPDGGRAMHVATVEVDDEGHPVLDATEEPVVVDGWPDG